MTPLWYEKYRPKTFDDYVWIDEQLKAKVDLYRGDPGKTPHMCLVGAPGTGKTTLAMLLANSMVNEPSDVLFVRSAKNSGVDAIRDIVDPFCQNAGWSEIKFVILDEAERLKNDAQIMLRDTINQYGDHVRFIFTCNSATNLQGAIDSRVRTIHFNGLDREQFMERILTILLAEEIELDEPGLVVMEKIVNTYYPDMRKTIDMLEDCCIGGKLSEANRVTQVDRPWMNEIISHVEGQFDITRLRSQIAELHNEQIVMVFEVLEERSAELFGKDERLAIIAIKDGMLAHSNAALPGLNLLGLFATLTLLKESA